MEATTGSITTRTAPSSIDVKWALASDGSVTANGEPAGRIIESLPTLFYALPANDWNWDASFPSAAEAAAALAALHVHRNHNRR